MSNENTQHIIAMKEDIGALTAEVRNLKELVSDLDDTVKDQTSTLNKYKGGGAALIAVAGFIGFIIAKFGAIVSMFGG